jgi:predicted PurR-regulated permease PerM
MRDVSQKSYMVMNVNRPSSAKFLFITALAGAVTTLIIGIVTFGKRRRSALSGGRNQEDNIDPSRVNKMANSPLTPSAVQFDSSSQEMVGMEPQMPMSADVSNQRNESEIAQVPVDGSDHDLDGYSSASTRWRLATKYVVGVGLFLALLFVLFLSRSTLSMIVFAALLAFVVYPFSNLIQKRLKLKRGQSIGLAYLLVILLIILIPLLLVPAIVQAFNNVISMDWQALMQNFAYSLQSAAEQASTIPVIGSSISSTLAGLSHLISGASALETPAPIVVDVSIENLTSQLAQTLGRLVSILGPLISAVISFFFMLLISLRMSLSVNEIREAYPKLVPPAYRKEITGLVERIIDVWNFFLRGELSLMFIMGFLTYLLNLVLGNSYPLFLGFLAGLLEVIPNLGPILATIPAILLALLVGSSYLPVSNLVFAIIVLLGYLLLTALENQVIVPKVLGDAVSLPPLVVIIGCVVGGATFGLLGVLLATPAISTGKEIFSYLYNKILEPPPQPRFQEEKTSMMDSFRGLAKRFQLPFRRRSKKPLPDQPQAGSTEGSLV